MADQPIPLLERSRADFLAALPELAQQGVDTDFLMREYSKAQSVTGGMDSEVPEGRTGVAGNFLSKPEGSTGWDAVRGLRVEPRAGAVGVAQGVEQALTAPGRAAQGTMPKADAGLEAFGTAGLVGGAGVARAGRGAGVVDEEMVNIFGGMNARNPGSTRSGEDAPWSTGADGEVRFEIDDSEFAVVPDNITVSSNKTVLENNSTLGDVMVHDELFHQYPEIADVPIIVDESLDGTRTSGYQIPSSDQYPNGLVAVSSELKRNPDRLRSVLIHEVQHDVQDREGFEPGSNLVGTEVGRSAAAERYVQAGRQEVENILANVTSESFEDTLSVFESMDKTGQLASELPMIRDTLNSSLASGQRKNRALNRMSERSFEAFTRFVRENPEVGLGEFGPYELPARVIRNPENFDLSTPGDDAYSVFKETLLGEYNIELPTAAPNLAELASAGYKTKAGEVEARNVQARMDMTPEERRQVTPQDTEDVAREFQWREGYAEGGLVSDVSNNAMADYFKASSGMMSEEEFIGKHKVSTKDFEDRFEAANNVDISGAESFKEITGISKGDNMRKQMSFFNEGGIVAPKDEKMTSEGYAKFLRDVPDIAEMRDSEPQYSNSRRREATFGYGPSRTAYAGRVNAENELEFLERGDPVYSNGFSNDPNVPLRNEDYSRRVDSDGTPLSFYTDSDSGIMQGNRLEALNIEFQELSRREDEGILSSKEGFLLDAYRKFMTSRAGMAEGGLAARRDPVSGNEIPPGSSAVEVRDDIDAKLSEGEYVVPADVVRFFGVNFFEQLRDKAKSGMNEMVADDRVGGQPAPAQISEDDMRSITEMAKGGIVDPNIDINGIIDRVVEVAKTNPELQSVFQKRGIMMAEGGLVDGARGNSQPTFNPGNWGTVGANLASGGPGGPGAPAMGAGGYNYVQYYGPDGVPLMVLYVNGTPAQTIPEGYTMEPPAPEGNTPTVQTNSGGSDNPNYRGGAMSSADGNSMLAGIGSPLRDVDFSDPDAVMDWADGRLTDPNKVGKNVGRVAGGAMGPMGSLVGTVVGGSWETGRDIASVNAAARYAEETGNTELAAELRAQAAEATDNWGLSGLVPETMYDGSQIFDDYLKELGAEALGITPMTGADRLAAAEATGVGGSSSSSTPTRTVGPASAPYNNDSNRPDSWEDGHVVSNQNAPDPGRTQEEKAQAAQDAADQLGTTVATGGSGRYRGGLVTRRGK